MAVSKRWLTVAVIHQFQPLHPVIIVLIVFKWDDASFESVQSALYSIYQHYFCSSITLVVVGDKIESTMTLLVKFPWNKRSEAALQDVATVSKHITNGLGANYLAWFFFLRLTN